jgi:hypothetical protein
VSEPEPRPVVRGYTIEWDPLNQEWLAVSSSGRFRLRGRSQAELNARQWALWSQVLADCRAAINEAFPHRDT